MQPKAGLYFLKPTIMRILYKTSQGILMEVHWQIGTPSPFREAPSLVWNVGEVTATGPELDWIKITLTGIPMADSRCVWYGDYAKFIVGNLPQ